MTTVGTTTTPETVLAATRAFGTPLRVELIKFFLANPGPQAAAVIALGESSANVSRNVQVLTDAGVVHVTAGGEHGARHYVVDTPRVTRLAVDIVGHIIGT